MAELPTLVVALIIGLAPVAMAADCPAPRQKPLVEIVVEDGPVEYDFTRTREELARLPGEVDAIVPNHGAVPLGLTVSKLTIRIATEGAYREIGRRYCAYPRRIALTLKYSSQRVFVDNRYPTESCQHRAVLAHELEHVRINRAALHAHEAELRAAIATLLAEHPFYPTSSGERAGHIYAEATRGAAAPVLQHIREDAKAQHALLDSSESYAATQRSCADW